MQTFSRRQFLTHIGHSGAWLAFLAACGAGADAALKGLVGRGLLPVAWADPSTGLRTGEADLLRTKPGMTVHSQQPINGEFAPHLLDDPIALLRPAISSGITARFRPERRTQTPRDGSLLLRAK